MQKEQTLTPAEMQAYWEGQVEMTAMPTWVDFLVEVEERLSALENIMTATPESLGQRQGAIEILEWVKHRREYASQVLDHLNNPEGSDEGL